MSGVDISRETVDALAMAADCDLCCVDTAITLRALSARIAELEGKLATAVGALNDIAETNGGGPIDRNNRMKRTARDAIALIEKETK